MSDMKKRVLIRAAIYRKFLFESQEALDEYMNSGHRERWIIDKFVKSNGHILAVIGETYNEADKLILKA